MEKGWIAVSKNSTINLRVDSEVKEQAGKILASMGLTFSEAFNLMLHQVRLQHALPFAVIAYEHTPKAETLKLLERIERKEEPLSGPFSSKEDLWESLGI
jgi:addiction module RelB/DinJ family antitoxin